MCQADKHDQNKEDQAAADDDMTDPAVAAREVEWSAETDDEPNQHEYPE
jgi:hypothetical protein